MTRTETANAKHQMHHCSLIKDGLETDRGRQKRPDSTARIRQIKEVPSCAIAPLAGLGWKVQYDQIDAGEQSHSVWLPDYIRKGACISHALMEEDDTSLLRRPGDDLSLWSSGDERRTE